MLATSNVFKHDLEQFNIDFPEIKSIHCRNDNAGCNSGASAIMAKKEICDSVGIKLESIGFIDQAEKGGMVPLKGNLRNLVKRSILGC